MSTPGSTLTILEDMDKMIRRLAQGEIPRHINDWMTEGVMQKALARVERKRKRKDDDDKPKPETKEELQKKLVELKKTMEENKASPEKKKKKKSNREEDEQVAHAMEDVKAMARAQAEEQIQAEAEEMNGEDRMANGKEMDMNNVSGDDEEEDPDEPIKCDRCEHEYPRSDMRGMDEDDDERFCEGCVEKNNDDLQKYHKKKQVACAAPVAMEEEEDENHWDIGYNLLLVADVPMHNGRTFKVVSQIYYESPDDREEDRAAYFNDAQAAFKSWTDDYSRVMGHISAGPVVYTGKARPNEGQFMVFDEEGKAVDIKDVDKAMQ